MRWMTFVAKLASLNSMRSVVIVGTSSIRMIGSRESSTHRTSDMTTIIIARVVGRIWTTTTVHWNANIPNRSFEMVGRIVVDAISKMVAWSSVCCAIQRSALTKSLSSV